MAHNVVGAFTGNAKDGANVTVNFSGLLENDILWAFAFVTHGSAGATIVSSGWDTDTSPLTDIDNSSRGSLYRKKMGASPDASVEFAGSGNAADSMGVIVAVLREANTTTPNDATTTTAVSATGGTTNPDCPSNTNVTVNAIALAFAGSRVNDASITVPTGYSGLTTVVANDENDDATVMFAWKLLTSIGAEDPPEFTGVSAGRWVAMHALSRPAAGINVSVGLSSEADSAFAISRAKLKSVGLSSESDSAFLIARNKLIAAGLSLESDSAFSIAFSKLLSVGLTIENDSSLNIARSKVMSIGIANETDSALAVTIVNAIIVAISQAIESDSAFSISRSKFRSIGIGNEIDDALSVFRSKIKSVGISNELDTAFLVAVSNAIIVSISQAIESDSALSVIRSKNRAVMLSIESNLALAISVVRRYAIGQASENEFSFALDIIKSISIGLAIESDISLPILFSGGAVARKATHGRPSHGISTRPVNISTGVRSGSQNNYPTRS